MENGNGKQNDKTKSGMEHESSNTCRTKQKDLQAY